MDIEDTLAGKIFFISMLVFSIAAVTLRFTGGTQMNYPGFDAVLTSNGQYAGLVWYDATSWPRKTARTYLTKQEAIDAAKREYAKREGVSA